MIEKDHLGIRAGELQIVFFERFAPMLRICVNGAERFMNVSQLECFLIRQCFDSEGEDMEAYETMVHAKRMLDLACCAYLKYFKTGEGDVYLPVCPNRLLMENGIIDPQIHREMGWGDE